MKSNQNYTTSYEILKNGNYDIILIELYPCDSKDILQSRERFYIELNNCVNKYIPGRTNKEYKQDNKEQISEQRKGYRQNNREQINEKKQVKCNCECGGKFTHNHRSAHMKCPKHRNFIKLLSDSDDSDN